MTHSNTNNLSPPENSVRLSTAASTLGGSFQREQSLNIFIQSCEGKWLQCNTRRYCLVCPAEATTTALQVCVCWCLTDLRNNAGEEKETEAKRQPGCVEADRTRTEGRQQRHTASQMWHTTSPRSKWRKIPRHHTTDWFLLRLEVIEYKHAATADKGTYGNNNRTQGSKTQKMLLDSLSSCCRFCFPLSPTNPDKLPPRWQVLHNVGIESLAQGGRHLWGPEAF